MDSERSIKQPVEKFDIKLKSNPKDGVILQLHHTVRGPNGECRRIRFSSATFDDTNEILACVDNGGNIFILDFADLKFWKLTGVGMCTALQFIPKLRDTVVIATANYEISFLDVENGVIDRNLTGHTAPVKYISYSHNRNDNLLTASPVEAILWELTNYTKYFTMNTYLGAQIQHIMFNPSGDYVVSCFQNDTVQIWKHETMKSVKQIIPNDLKHMKCLAFTANGRAMAMGGLASTLILFSMDTWKALKSLDLTKFNIAGAQHIAFVPQVFDGGANKILAILSGDCVLYLLDIETCIILHKVCPEGSGIKKFLVSPTGKYFLCILQLGEVNIYSTSHVMEQLVQKVKASPEGAAEVPSTSSHKRTRNEQQVSRAEVEQKMRICMDSARLRRILMQYGEYPDKFRSIIWRSLLNTPRNKSAYSALVEKGIHQAYKDIEQQFTIHSSVSLKNLKRLLSCLAHWCPLFGVMKFLPGFTFPFVKVLQKDSLLLFECVATVLLNYCQLWFEYAPFPPISILAMIENILAEHDPSLLDHYCDLGITSQTYALKILETAFSEVLSCSEWLILWDHILSNEPSFILMAVVSYNIVQRNPIRKLINRKQIENFFHTQNPIDKKTFLKKAYLMLKSTPDEIHPRRFLQSFVSLEKGDSYQQFTGYPKATICMKLEQKRRDVSRKESYSLKDLTRMSQEKIIKNSLMKNEYEIWSTSNDSTTEDDKRKNVISKGKGDCVNKNVRDEMLKNVMCPVVTACNKKANGTQPNNKKGKCNKKSINNGKRNEKLEEEVEKIMKAYTNSDQSCP